MPDVHAEPRAEESGRLPTGRAAVTGVLALVAALAAGHLTAALVSPTASPYVAVGDAVIDLAPAWLVEFAKEAFGTANKLVLAVGMAVVLIGLAVLAGLASRRRPGPGVLVIAALGAVGVAAVLSRPDLETLAVVSPLASVLAGAAAFAVLHRAAWPQADTGRTSTSRRRFLVSSAAVAAGAGVAGATGQWFTGPDVEASRRAVGRLVPATRAPAIPPGADFAAEGTPSLITPNREFYTIHTALVVPRVPAEDWRLRLHGMVARPMTLTYDQLRSRQLVERTITLACVSNPVGGELVSTANFLGVDLADLLDEAGVAGGAEQLFSTSADGFTIGTQLDAVLDHGRGAMLAIGMNGEPLPVKHGFPVRMVVPGLYGYVSATKWLVDLEVTTWKARTPYWVPRGWARKAPVKTQSRIDTPSDGAEVEEGRVVVAGTAWAPHTGIRGVEVRVDDGPWRSAELAEEVNVDTWRMWRAELAMPGGAHRISCRATDADGRTQPGRQTPVEPDGATGWHSVRVTAG